MHIFHMYIYIYICIKMKYISAHIYIIRIHMCVYSLMGTELVGQTPRPERATRPSPRPCGGHTGRGGAGEGEGDALGVRVSTTLVV